VADRRDRRAHGFTKGFGIGRSDAKPGGAGTAGYLSAGCRAFETLRSVSGGRRPTALVGPKIDLEPDRMQAEQDRHSRTPDALTSALSH